MPHRTVAPVARRGQHRQVAAPEIMLGQATVWFTRGLAALIVFGLVGMVGFLFLTDRGSSLSDHGASLADRGAAGSPVGPLDSRERDAGPLTMTEVFPDPETVAAADPPYRVLITHDDTDCATATTGRLGEVLTAFGCGQVIRAGLEAPYGDHRATVGVLDLADADAAAEVDGLVRRLVETGDGSFAALPSGDGDAAGQVGWVTRGHYLLYCVITRPGGKLVDTGDAERITADLVDRYLGETVLGRRGSLS